MLFFNIKFYYSVMIVENLFYHFLVMRQSLQAKCDVVPFLNTDIFLKPIFQK